MFSLAIVTDDNDNIATLVNEGKHGNIAVAEIGNKKIETELISDIPCFHKYALRDISKGEDIFKYGEIIGYASQDIKKGEHIHIQNVESNRGRGDIKGGESK